MGGQIHSSEKGGHTAKFTKGENIIPPNNMRLKMLFSGTLHSSAADIFVAFQLKCNCSFKDPCFITGVSSGLPVEVNSLSVSVQGVCTRVSVVFFFNL